MKASAVGERKRYGVVSSALIVVAMRWADRLLGLISTLVLARLLVPDDFGVIAMASIVYGFVTVLMNLGVNAALIHDKEATQDDYDTAWTIRLIEAIVAGLVLAALAPAAANYFNDPRVVDVMRVMAVTVAVAGLDNIGLVTFQKEMQFGSDFLFFFLRRFAGFLVTLILAFVLRSYWAMVIGSLVGKLVGVALSYAMHEMRPKLSLRKVRKIWSFSQLMLLANIGNYLSVEMDKLVLGARVSAATLGGYRLGDDIASMPTSEVLAPLGRVLFPSFVEARDEPDQLRQQFLLALGVQVALVLPAAVGLALVADSAVPVLLGDQWAFAVPFIRWLALGQLAVALSHATTYLFMSLGRVGSLATISLGRVAVFMLLVLTVFAEAGGVVVAQLRGAVGVASVVALVVLLLRTMQGLTLADLARATWRPALGCALMAAVLTNVATDSLPSGLALLIDVSIGAGVYGATIIGTWRLAGRPAGVESWVARRLGLHQRVPWLLGAAPGE
ncbi:MAG: lipopolysaccharide biosynthesis protein [Pseudomonadota bacterium]